MDVWGQIAEALDKSAPEVQNKFVAFRVESEVQRRVDLLHKGFLKLDKMRQEFYLIKDPTERLYGPDGKEVPRVYTSEELKKHREAMNKYNNDREQAERKIKAFAALIETCVNSMYLAKRDIS